MVQEINGRFKDTGVWKMPTGAVNEVSIYIYMQEKNKYTIIFSWIYFFSMYRVRIFVQPQLEKSKKRQE